MAAIAIFIDDDNIFIFAHLERNGTTHTLKRNFIDNGKVSVRQQCVYEALLDYLRQINARNTILKSTFSRLQHCRWQYWSIFIRLAEMLPPKYAKFSENSNL